MSDVTLTPADRKTRADSLRNHELILCTARGLFDVHGVANVTMSAVAEAAQIGKGTLYRHFPDKSELLFALIGHEADALRAEVDGRYAIGEPPAATLHWFVDKALDYSFRNNSLLCEATNHAPMGTLSHPSRIWWRDTMTDLFQQAGSAGDPAYAADTVYMMLDPITLFFQQNDLGYTSARIAENIHMLVDGLLK